MLTPWKESYDQPRQHIKKQRHYFANKSPSSQSYGFSSGHVWMWELDCEESWVLKSWCFWTVLLEKTLESPLDCKEIQPVHPKGDKSWVFTGRTDAEAETLVLWHPHAKSWLIGKDPDAGRDWGQEKGRTEEEMAGWHHGLDRHEFEWTPRVCDGQGGLACCNSWGWKESDTTEQLNWTCFLLCLHASLLQACPTLCNPVDCSLPVFSVHGILQARILEWVAFAYSRGLSRPRDWTRISYVSCIHAGMFFIAGTTWEALPNPLQ